MSAENLERDIKRAWGALERQVEAGTDFHFDHAFTYQFHLAWHLSRLLNFANNLNIRFEVPCGRGFDHETIRLDLLVWMNPDEKVAIELKAPLRSETGMNSAMTQF